MKTEVILTMTKRFCGMATAAMLMIGAGAGITNGSTATPEVSADPADYRDNAYTDPNGMAKTAVSGSYLASFADDIQSDTITAFVFSNDFIIGNTDGSRNDGYMDQPAAAAEIQIGYMEND